MRRGPSNTTKSSEMSTALLDGDVVAFRCAVAVEKTVDWFGCMTHSSNASAAIRNACRMAKAWIDGSGADDGILFFSDSSNFRKEIAPDYKANRKLIKPVAYSAVVEALSKRFEVIKLKGLEADDAIGVHMETDGSTIAVSIDKDFKTIPGHHYHPINDHSFVISEKQANFTWMCQTLIGDTIDGYKGCVGYGPKRAQAALAGATNLKTLWTRVVAIYKRNNQTEEAALKQARLARILRKGDYDFDTGTIKLWIPS